MNRWFLVALFFTLQPGASAADNPARPRAEIYAALLERQNLAAAALESARAEIAQLEALLAPFALADEDLAAVVSRAAAARDQRLLAVQELEALLQQLRTLLKLDADSVAEALAQAIAQRERLLVDESALRREIIAVKSDDKLQTAIALDGMTSQPFLLTGGRIAPFAEPYFSAQLIKVRLADRRVVERPRYTREGDAGTIADAIAPGGALHALVTSPDFDRERTYVTLWVCADAIDGYRAVVNFLKSHQVRYTWIADVDAPWTALDEDAPLGTWGYGG